MKPAVSEFDVLLQVVGFQSFLSAYVVEIAWALEAAGAGASVHR